MGDDGPQRRLRVRVSDGRGRPVADRQLARWIRRIAPSRARGIVSIALVSDARSRALNRRYRGKDYATDVLSFPAVARVNLSRAWAGQARRSSIRWTPTSAFLGDIVIARGVARRQAREAGHDEPTEWRVLALHGLLHLLGYDHERDSGTMKRVEMRLRRKGGLREALTERR
jgi:probable rRNA maturation factor